LNKHKEGPCLTGRYTNFKIKGVVACKGTVIRRWVWGRANKAHGRKKRGLKKMTTYFKEANETVQRNNGKIKPSG